MIREREGGGREIMTQRNKHRWLHKTKLEGNHNHMDIHSEAKLKISEGDHRTSEPAA